jgi:hypothetical protein
LEASLVKICFSRINCSLNKNFCSKYCIQYLDDINAAEPNHLSTASAEGQKKSCGSGSAKMTMIRLCNNSLNDLQDSANSRLQISCMHA